jgi:GntR family histidine utilization transcriptional repressor
MTTALHERIRSEIETQILSGALAPGARLPIEHDLMRSYGCSRMTVSKALSALAAAGLVERRKRAGSFVARPRLHSMVLDVPDLAIEIEGRGQAYRYRLVRRTIRAARSDDKDAGLDVGSGRLLELRGVHLADGVPLAFEHRLVSLAAVPQIEAACFDEEPPGSWLLRHVPWTEAETRIAAIGADRATAAMLGAAAGTACLLVERRTWRGEESVTAVRQYFLGSAYDLIARFSPSGRASPAS